MEEICVKTHETKTPTKDKVDVLMPGLNFQFKAKINMHVFTTKWVAFTFKAFHNKHSSGSSLLSY